MLSHKTRTCYKYGVLRPLRNALIDYIVKVQHISKQEVVIPGKRCVTDYELAITQVSLKC